MGSNILCNIADFLVSDCYICTPIYLAIGEVRVVAQPGSAFAWGARGRWFESSPPDGRASIPRCSFLLGESDTVNRLISLQKQPLHTLLTLNSSKCVFLVFEPNRFSSTLPLFYPLFKLPNELQYPANIRK